MCVCAEPQKKKKNILIIFANARTYISDFLPIYCDSFCGMYMNITIPITQKHKRIVVSSVPVCIQTHAHTAGSVAS